MIAPCECEYPHIGAQAAGTPVQCEDCHRLVKAKHEPDRCPLCRLSHKE